MDDVYLLCLFYNIAEGIRILDTQNEEIFKNWTLLSDWVWVSAPKREHQKCRNEAAKIFFKRAKNQSAKNTIVPKNYSLISNVIGTSVILALWFLGTLVIFWRNCKN